MSAGIVHFAPPIHTCCLCGRREQGRYGESYCRTDHLCSDKRACLVRVRDLTKTPIDGSAARGLPRSPEPYRHTYGISVNS